MSKTAFIIITSKCNRSCPFCYYKQDNFRTKDDKLDSFDFYNLVKNLKGAGFNELTVTGGEPLLKKELSLGIIKEANKENFKINLSTNGTLLDQQTIEDLKKVNKFKIYLSSRYINSLRDFSLEELSFVFSIIMIHVVTRENFNDLKRIIRIADKSKIKLIIQPAYINETNQHFNQLSLKNLDNQKRIDFENILNKWADKNKKETYFNLIHSYYLKDKSGYPNSCHMGTDDIVIDSDGSVFPCFHRQDLRAGNVLEDSLENILIRIKGFSRQAGSTSCFSEYCIPLFY